MTHSPESVCPSPFDIEPTCFNLEPQVALEHARRVCRDANIPEESVRTAMGLVIPNHHDQGRILYGLRDPEYHTEYRDTWGLPSIGVGTDDFLRFTDNSPIPSSVTDRLSQLKLGNIPLQPERIVGWTGRLRLTHQDPQFETDYYLILVDVKTEPVHPDLLPTNTAAYKELRWFTPEEHAQFVETTPHQACGACSELASLADRLERL